MGGKNKQLSAEEELGSLIAGGGDQPAADDPRSELDSLIAAPSQGGVYVEPDPNLQAPDARGTLEQLLDPGGKMEIGLANGRSPVDVDTERNGGVGPAERIAQAVAGSTPADAVFTGLGRAASVGANALSAGAQAGLEHYRDDPQHGVLEALLAARDGGLAGLGLGATGLGVGAAGGVLQSGADRARQAAFRASKDDLRALGVTPAEFAQRTDELGLNNRFKPMDPADKRARIGEVLADRGQRGTDAVAYADAQNPLEGRNVNSEIARDVDANADRVWTGRSNQREGIVNAMGKTANAVEQGAPIDSLAELRNYRSQQGGQAFGAFGTLPEAASGKGALAGYDSADQHLHEAMRMSGDANYQQFTSADNDFHDAKLLEELTNQPQASNPWRRAVGATVGAGLGMAVGGPAGAAVGAGVSDLTRGYHADAAANALSLGAGALQGAGNAMQATAPAMGTATEQLQQVRNQSRGQDAPDVVESLLQNPPPWMQKYAQLLAKAKEDGNLSETLYKLENTDDNWKRNVLPQIQQLTGQQH